MRKVVVYVHGLWMVGIEGELLRRRLSKMLHARAPFFKYRSVRDDLLASAHRLAARLSALDAQELHLVGHSMGGVIILKMFQTAASAALPPGRVVFLGSPLAGSRAARAFAKLSVGRRMLGKTVAEALIPLATPQWTAARELGVIAGSRNLGLGRLVNRLDAPSDGTVYVDETRIAGMKEHIVVPVTHTGLPMSSSVARLTALFLHEGTFADARAHGA